ncbi:MAG TPA: hypothetical protein VFO03_09735 [Gaiellaceae bacterium]|nr:hypothetical protein [Gaiellaceae bacterium]
MRAAGALAVVPGLVVVALVLRAASDDRYYQDGRSYWETHGDHRAFFVLMVGVNVVAVSALISTAIRDRPALWIGVVLVCMGLVAGFAGLVSITAN